MCGAGGSGERVLCRNPKSRPQVHSTRKAHTLFQRIYTNCAENFLSEFRSLLKQPPRRQPILINHHLSRRGGSRVYPHAVQTLSLFLVFYERSAESVAGATRRAPHPLTCLINTMSVTYYLRVLVYLAVVLST